MDASLLAAWLYRCSGPILRWRTAAEILPEISPVQRDTHFKEMLSTPLVQTWLGRLTSLDFSTLSHPLSESDLGHLGALVHGGKANHLENVLGKLAEFGLHPGLPAMDQFALSAMQIFRWNPRWDKDTTFRNAWATLVKSVFAWGLLRLGYPPDTAMQDFLYEHLSTCHKIARDQVFDIYARDADLIGLPKAWQGKAIIKQEVMADYWLPYIHDLYVFAHFPQYLLDETASRMITELIDFVFDPRFQSLPEGYGYAWIKERRTCYSWGWSPHLPGYLGFAAIDPSKVTPLVLRLELMSHFPQAKLSSWFQQGVQHLESFCTAQGTYHFPGNYLKEAEGYYVSGFGMGLGEDRRRSLGIELESSFRMLKIVKPGGFIS